MNRGDINALQAAGGSPALTLTAPLRRQAADEAQPDAGAACLRALVGQAKRRLWAELAERDAHIIVQKLDTLMAELDLTRPQGAICLAVNAQLAKGFMLPVRLEPNIVIASAFATQQLRFALNRAPRYWLLVLGEAPTRLFEGAYDALIEVEAHGFPAYHDAPAAKQGERSSASRDEQQRAFFRTVDEQLAPLLQDDPVPLVVVGAERQLAQFFKGCNHKRLIMTTLQGRHETTPADELGALVWPTVEADFAERREAVLSALDAAVDAQRYVSDLSSAWRMAQAGRGDTLVVEEGFHRSATLSADGLRLEPSDDPSAPGFMPDAVAELIEIVTARRGQIVFVAPGALGERRLVLTLRY